MASAISFFNGPAQRSNSATLTWLAPVRVLADYLERHPDALLWGKEKPPAAEKKEESKTEEKK